MDKLPTWLRAGAVWTARLAVAGVFLAAAIPKLLDPVAFATDVANYQAFPYWSVNLIAGVVPLAELAAAVALLVPRSRKAAALTLAGMNVVFIALIASVLVRDVDIACGCFGKAEEADAIGWPTLVRDLVLMVGIALAALPAWPGEGSSEAGSEGRSDRHID